MSSFSFSISIFNLCIQVVLMKSIRKERCRWRKRAYLMHTFSSSPHTHAPLHSMFPFPRRFALRLLPNFSPSASGAPSTPPPSSTSYNYRPICLQTSPAVSALLSTPTHPPLPVPLPLCPSPPFSFIVNANFPLGNDVFALENFIRKSEVYFRYRVLI